jgi:bifunctional oligoribonuclease and PAP phosphatase NrnA
MRRIGVDAAAVSEALRGARSVVVCGHVNPDGDAVGSVLGATLALQSLGVEVVPTLADAKAAPVLYAFLPGFPLLQAAEGLEPPEVFLALDVPSLPRLGAAEGLARASSRIVVIDHHPDNGSFGAVNWADPTAAATGQTLWRLLPSLGVKPTPEIARCCYVALMTDTGRFSYGNTDADVFRDAAEMVSAGADPFHTYTATYESQSAAAMRLLGLVLSRVTIANGGLVAYSWVTDGDLDETHGIMAETENLVDVVRTVGGVDAVFLVKCAEGSCRVSLRSKTGTDIGEIARRFGGGGHAAAAGFTAEGSLDDVVGSLLPLLPGGDGE